MRRAGRTNDGEQYHFAGWHFIFPLVAFLCSSNFISLDPDVCNIMGKLCVHTDCCALTDTIEGKKIVEKGEE